MPDLTPQDIQKLARLSRLEVGAGDVDRYRAELGAVLGWMERLGEMDLDGVEPMTRAETGDGANHGNRLDDDNPGPVLANDVVMGLAPEAMPPFFRVPRVLGEGGGA
ncbi:MAG: Asp-tRNA(Asn)/Glu-tRNA(Gln) amidotransferase subunit GatC [Phycisphaerales bacterium JB041]